MTVVLLNRNEEEALRILWQKGELKPAEIQADFSWPIENATLRSVLMNLVGKKHARRRRQGKAFFYAARVPKATLLQNLVQHLARVFAGGSERELIAQLAETADIKPADLILLRQTATETTPSANKRSPK